MEQRPSEGFFVKLRMVLLILLFVFGLCSIVGTGGGGGSSSGTGGTFRRRHPGGHHGRRHPDEDERRSGHPPVGRGHRRGGRDQFPSREEELPQGLITVTPDAIDLENLPGTITVVIDFGAGYTTETGASSREAAPSRFPTSSFPRPPLVRVFRPFSTTSP